MSAAEQYEKRWKIKAERTPECKLPLQTTEEEQDI